MKLSRHLVCTRLLIVLVSAIVGLAINTVLVSTKAQATNFGGCPSGALRYPCFANDSNHIFSYQLGTRLRAAFEATRLGSYETTNLDTSLGDHEIADVWVYVDNDLQPPSLYGVYSCLSGWFSTGRCGHAHIAINGGNVSSFSDATLKSLACHETGHSLGLLHPSSDTASVYGCMVQDGWPTLLLPHNVAHIDSKYP